MADEDSPLRDPDADEVQSMFDEDAHPAETPEPSRGSGSPEGAGKGGHAESAPLGDETRGETA